jgi:DNA-binding transcriptional MerR regulator
MAGATSNSDPLVRLREYRQLAPWSLRDLTALAAAILDSAAVRPINAAAAASPSERTVRFYVSRHLVDPPEGRGTAATYSYRHLLQVLAIKLRQMEGATLSKIADELEVTTGDVLERRVAGALGPGLPLPGVLPLLDESAPPRGRAGQLFRPAGAATEPVPGEATTVWHRLPVADGVELHVRGDHPAARDGALPPEAAEAVRLALHRVTYARRESAAGPGPSDRADISG